MPKAENVNEDNGGNQLYEEENNEGEEMDYNQQQSENMNDEGKGLVKEYYSNGKLLFEDEYLNGLRNGKGKEYNDNGELRFEGEYLNGLINGKGKEYDYDGNLIFEGEYLNGRRWEGKGYDNRKNMMIKGN